MNEEKDPLELELKALLDVDPSPGLQSRIRARAYAKPEPRIPWFVWSAGLATAAIAVTFAVLYVQRPAQVMTPVAPAPPAVAPIVSTEPAAETLPARKPVRLAIAFRIEPLKSDKIEMPPLEELDLTETWSPLPQENIPAVSRLEPISLEPLSLTVRNLGVNE